MKNLFFALLACLLTACFRAPHLSTLPIHSPATPAPGAAAPLPPDREVYASAAQVAAAGTAPVEAGEPYRAPASPATYAPTGHESTPATAAKAVPATAPLRRELRKAVRAALLKRTPVAVTQDNPAPGRSALPAIALASGLIGILSLLGSFVAGAASAGPLGGLLFLLAFVGGLLGIILGGIAKGRIRRGKDAERGRGMANAGFILGIVDLSIIVLLFVLVALLAAAFSTNR
jgi:hypothetical protein